MPVSISWWSCRKNSDCLSILIYSDKLQSGKIIVVILVCQPTLVLFSQIFQQKCCLFPMLQILFQHFFMGKLVFQFDTIFTKCHILFCLHLRHLLGIAANSVIISCFFVGPKVVVVNVDGLSDRRQVEIHGHIVDSDYNLFSGFFAEFEEFNALLKGEIFIHNRMF